MNEIDYKQHNERFDRRFNKLLKAGFNYYRNAWSTSGLGRKAPYNKTVFITTSELMWKPTEAFEFSIQEIIKD